MYMTVSKFTSSHLQYHFYSFSNMFQEFLDDTGLKAGFSLVQVTSGLTLGFLC